MLPTNGVVALVGGALAASFLRPVAAKAPPTENLTPAGRRLKQAACSQIGHQGVEAELPYRSLVAVVDAVVHGAQLLAADDHAISELVGETGARGITVFSWGEQGAEEQQETVRVLVIAIERLLDQIQRIATDLVHRATAFKHIAVITFDAQTNHGIADILDAECIVEQADERADGAGGIVVLGLSLIHI